LLRERLCWAWSVLNAGLVLVIGLGSAGLNCRSGRRPSLCGTGRVLDAWFILHLLLCLLSLL